MLLSWPAGWVPASGPTAGWRSPNSFSIFWAMERLSCRQPSEGSVPSAEQKIFILSLVTNIENLPRNNWILILKIYLQNLSDGIPLRVLLTVLFE